MVKFLDAVLSIIGFLTIVVIGGSLASGRAQFTSEPPFIKPVSKTPTPETPGEPVPAHTARPPVRQPLITPPPPTKPTPVESVPVEVETAAAPAEVRAIINRSRYATELRALNEMFGILRPSKGKVFLIANVTAIFRGPGKVWIGPEDFSITASNNNIYRAQRAIMTSYQGIDEIDGQLIDGGQTTGDVVFEVDAGARPVSIECSAQPRE